MLYCNSSFQNVIVSGEALNLLLQCNVFLLLHFHKCSRPGCYCLLKRFKRVRCPGSGIIQVCSVHHLPHEEFHPFFTLRLLQRRCCFHMLPMGTGRGGWRLDTCKTGTTGNSTWNILARRNGSFRGRQPQISQALDCRIQIVATRLQNFLYKIFFHLREEGMELRYERAFKVMPGRPRLQAGLERTATCGAGRGRGCRCCAVETDGRTSLSEAQALGYRRGAVQILKHRPLPTNCGRHCIQKSPFSSSVCLQSLPPPSSLPPRLKPLQDLSFASAFPPKTTACKPQIWTHSTQKTPARRSPNQKIQLHKNQILSP